MVPGYLLENDYIGVKRARHGIFIFNRNDRLIGRSLDLYGEWCESEIALLRNFVGPGETVLDIGANIGTHTVAFASAVERSGTVIAFEPQRLAFQLLCGNVAINCLTNVRCLQKAAGASDGTVAVPALSPHESRNFAALSLDPTFAGESVEIVRIDSLGLKSCRLMKIDVEGMEAEVLAGARETVAALQPILFVENNTVDRASRTIGAILDLGYKAWWHLGLYYNRGNFFDNGTNAFAAYQPEANLLCMPGGEAPDVPTLIECTGIDDNWMKARDRGIAARNPLFFPPRADE